MINLTSDQFYAVLLLIVFGTILVALMSRVCLNMVRKYRRYRRFYKTHGGRE